MILLLLASPLLAGDTWTNVAPGIDWLHRVESGSTPQDIHAVAIDLSRSTISLRASMDETGSDRGPVNALAKALSKDLGPYQACIDDMKLVDFKVRITNGGTEAVTRVIIDSEDGQGHRWSTVGVSANIIDASFEALLDAIQWKLIRDFGVAADVRP